MSEENHTYCVIDAGNTQIKIVDFEQGEIVNHNYLPFNKINKIHAFSIDRKISILSSVLSQSQHEKLVEIFKPTVVLNQNTKLPISLKGYKTPQTLGSDRIANAVAAHTFAKTKAVLVIDIGTCIKYDLVVEGEYQGGGISPGYTMRLDAMHEFTGALPKLEWENYNDFIGKSTKESMLTGVNKGIENEIQGFIEHYRNKYQELTIFLTGGDLKRFEIELKNDIFVDNNLTVKGLYIILRYNV